MEDVDIPAFCDQLGIPGLADLHVHFLPPRLLRRIWAYFDAGGPLLGGDRPWAIHYRLPDDADRVRRLRAMRVRYFTALAYAHRPDMAADLNTWTLDFAERTPDCVPSATFYPEPSVKKYVAEALARGARVFKLHPQVGDFSPADPLLDPVWGLLSDAGTPVVIHAGHSPAGTRHTGPGPVTGLLKQHPELPLVIAHMGAPDYPEFLRLAAAHGRVALDTTMVFTGYFDRFPASELPLVKELGQAGKILLGSDFPNIPYPYARQIAGLADLDLGDAWLRAVCWDNPLRLLGITAQCPDPADGSDVPDEMKGERS
jgi:uncharacterized protein